MGGLIQAINNVNATVTSTTGGWSPPGWGNAKTFPIWTLTVPPSSQPTPFTPSLNYGLPVSPIIYVFDAILRADHEEGIRMTEFPVQTGSNISDNAYILQNRVTLEIGMSDVMASYTPGQWTGGGSGMMQTKSVAAYNVLTSLKDARQFVTLATRVKIYPQMLVERVTISDTVNTLHGLRAQVTFRQVFVASVTVGQLSPTAQTSSTAAGNGTAVSARPHSTVKSQGVSAQTGTPTTEQQRLFEVPGLSTANSIMEFGQSVSGPVPGSNVSGATPYSSFTGPNGGLTLGGTTYQP